MTHATNMAKSLTSAAALMLAVGMANDVSANSTIRSAVNKSVNGGTAGTLGCMSCHSNGGDGYSDLTSAVVAAWGPSVWPIDLTTAPGCTHVDALRALFNISGTTCPVTTPVNVPPTVTAPASKSVIGDGTHALSFTVTAADSDGTVSSLAVDPATLPSGATFTASSASAGTFAWTPSAADVSTTPYHVIFNAKDNTGDTGTAATDITVSAAPVNQPPAVTVPLTTQTVVLNQTLTFDVKAHDPEGNNVSISSSNLPAGATLSTAVYDASTNYWTSSFSWTPTALPATTPFTVTFTATDDGSPAASASKDVKIDVKDSTGALVSTVTVSKAAWINRYSKLSAAGVVTPLVAGSKLPAGLTVTLFDASGAQLGTPVAVKQSYNKRTKKYGNGTWTFGQKLSAAPCQITASVGGATSSPFTVSGAPVSCSSSEDDSTSSDDHTTTSTSSTSTSSSDDSSTTTTTTKGKKKHK